LTNHSYDPNLYLEIIGEDIFAVSLRQISEDEELTIDYEDALDLVAIRQNAAINEKVLKITPGFENLNIEDDTDKNLIDEIKILRKVK
jgi:SET domain-containing protein